MNLPPLPRPVAAALGALTLTFTFSLAAPAPAARAQAPRSDRTFRVTVSNLTTGQIFSPPYAATHNAQAPAFFTVGQPASFFLQRLAEEGNSGPTSSAVVVPNLGLEFGSARSAISLLPGQERSFYIATDLNHPLLSMYFMLVRTNDGFSGFNAFNLYGLGGVGKSVSFDLTSYDAGTERNNERQPFLIALAGNQRDPENGVVTTPHPGIRGDADAPKSWDFNPALPVARVTITRVLPVDEFPLVERAEAQESFDSTPR